MNDNDFFDLEKKMLLINNKSLDPYFNHALEEYFLKSSNQEYFVLWRSNPCILIGKNQNAYNEINIEYVSANDLPVVRRLSGGGAIFNDLGNILFGFISNEVHDVFGDFKRFTAPIINVLHQLGINAELTGRNDLTIEGKKFSGNAQARHNNRIIHHGSILYSSNMSQLSAALKVNPLKFKDKAVKSTISRVTNISEYLKNPMEVEEFMNYLFDYIIKTDKNSEIYTLSVDDIKSIEKIKTEKTSTLEWNFGNSPKYSFVKEKKFSGGVLQINLNIKNGYIDKLKVYGDFFSQQDITELETKLEGNKFEELTIKGILKLINVDNYMKNITIANILELMFS